MSEPTNVADLGGAGSGDALLGTTVAGRYRIDALLGSGGMGAVYRAEHVHMKKTVALKVLHRELTSVEEVVARFEREAVAAARIEHPNVAAARDFGKLEDGSFYLVLEHVAGQSLRALIDQGPLDWRRAVGIARQTTAALVAAHGAGIVHRDLKPDNVMLVDEPDGSERVKVLDFGIARVTAPDPRHEASHLTRVGVVMGTVAYMSPEQALGQAVDERTDLYALGVMIHEMLTARLPFEAETAAQILAQQITATPPAPPPGTPAALATLTRELLGKTAAERPASAAQVLERLDAIASARATPLGALGAFPRNVKLVAAVGAGAALIGALSAFALAGGGEDPASLAEPESAEGEERPSAAATARAALAGSETRSQNEGQAAQDSKVEESAPDPAQGEPPEKASDSAASASAAPAASARKATPAKKRPASGSKTQKKRTGPGGIYIPPPDQWFK